MDYFEDILKLAKKHIFAIGSIIFGVSSIIGSIVYVCIALEPCEPCEICNDDFSSAEYEQSDEKETPKMLVVDVKGAVKKPGVYEFVTGSKIQDAITAAGGVAIGGSTANINLSKKLTDEMVVYVFTKEELTKKEIANEVVCEIPKCECETVTITECPNVNGNNVGDSEQNSSGGTVADVKVSLNNGTVEDFQKLDGIGEAKAKTIVEYRETNGPFESIEDIQKVSGIGSALYEKIKDKLTL